MDKAAQYAEAAALFKQAVAEGADEAQARAAYDAAVARIAAMPDAPKQALEGAAIASGSPQTPQNAPGVPKVPPTGFEAVKGALATGLQGATFGFADEAVGLVSPESGEALRTSASDFTKAYPKTAFGLNLAGGVATSGGLGGVAKAGIPLASKAAALLSKSAIAQGALAGAGMSEGNLADRGMEALTGGALGGAVGGAVGQAGKVLGRMGARRLAGTNQPSFAAQRALTALAKRVEDTDLGADGLAMAGAANTAQGATIADNLGVPGERMLRGLRTTGGRAGEKIETVMNSRLRQYPERIIDALYNGKTIENVVQTTDDLVEARSQAARPLYEAFRKEPSAFVPEIDELLKRPLFKKAVAMAEDYQLNSGAASPKIALPGGETRTLHSPEFLDNVKKSLDDLIYKGRQPGEGGMGPGAMKQAKELREAYVAQLDRAFPTYKAARDAWAGPAALKEALENGIDAAGGGGTPEQLRKTLGQLSESEREMFQRGFVDQLRQQVGKGGMKPAKTEQRDLIARIESVFGDDSNMILTRLRDEVAANRTATTITKGSQTADKAGDVLSELSPSGGHLSRMVFLPQRFKADVVDNLIEAAANPFSGKTRNELADLLLSPADDARVLKAIAGESKAQARGNVVGRNLKPAGAATLETTYGFFRSPRDEQGKRR